MFICINKNLKNIAVILNIETTVCEDNTNERKLFKIVTY